MTRYSISKQDSGWNLVEFLSSLTGVDSTVILGVLIFGGFVLAGLLASYLTSHD